MEGRPIVLCNASKHTRCNNTVRPIKHLPANALRCPSASALRVLTGWSSLECAHAGESTSRMAVNALTGEEVPHADEWALFEPASFPVRMRSEPRPLSFRRWDENITLVDFLGVRYPRPLFCNMAYAALYNEDAHAIRMRQCSLSKKLLWAEKLGHLPQVGASAAWPVVAEEYFEYLDVLAAVIAYAPERRALARHRPFTSVELGSGYGHWAFAAYKALQQRAPDAPHHLLLVDVVGSLQPAIQHLAQINGVRVDGPNHTLHFHAGFVSERGQTGGLEGAAMMARQYEGLWGTGKSPASSLQAGATLDELFDRYQTPWCIDMVDIDIQGGEYVSTPTGKPGLFHAERSIRTLTRRARRVHIGLHGGEEHDAKLLAKFAAHGWKVRWHFPRNFDGWHTGVRTQTPWGPVQFSDGVLSLINTRWPTSCGATLERGRKF